MKTRRLGDSDLEVTEISLGSWLTYSGGVERYQTEACTRAAFDAGINFFDTANAYGDGASETAWGEILSDYPRDSYVLATKVYFEGSAGGGLSAEQIAEQIDLSLERLQTDYVDLYQVHQVDPSTPIYETLSALDTLVSQGKVRYLGCSNFAAWQICESLWASDRKNLTPFVSVQPRYNLMDRAIERELLPFCRQYGIGIIPYSPLNGGILTGKYKEGESPPPDTRAGRQDRLRNQLTPDLHAKVGALGKWAQDQGHTAGDLALAWLLSRPEVSTIIAGATRPEQVESNAKAAEWKLSESDLKQIDQTLGI